MSALPPKADMCGATMDVGFGPKADPKSSANRCLIRQAYRRAEQVRLGLRVTFSSHDDRGRLRSANAMRAQPFVMACLRGLRQGRAIIGCELFNSLAGQLMLNVKALPWLVESELLIEHRLAGCGVFEITVGHRKAVAS